MESQEIKTHLREHIEFPATKQQVMQACNMMSHVPEAERDWFQSSLPDGTYNSADEVLQRLNM